MRLWAASTQWMLGPGCNATTLPATGAPLLLVPYEGLRADTGAQLRRVLEFVGV